MLTVTEVPLDKISPDKDQPRRSFDKNAIDDLAKTIKRFGIISPIILREKDESYIIIAGERRYRAAKLIGLKTVPAIIRKNENIREISLIENMQREDLNPIEEARGIAALINENGYTHMEAAKLIGKSRPYITNKLRLLSLDDDLKELLVSGKITQGHAIALLAKKENERKKLAKRILAEDLSVREAEHSSSEPNQSGSMYFDNAVNLLEENLDTKVDIHSDGEKGQIIIEFYSKKQFEDIASRIVSL